MTGEEMEKAIEFILHQQAKAEAETQEMREEMREGNKQMQEAIRQLTANGDRLQSEAEADRQAIREAFAEFRIDIDRLVDIVESDRETFSKSISALSNAVTEDRKLLREVARLATASEKRLASLEGPVDNIENPQS